jgi:hypothetical protein
VRVGTVVIQKNILYRLFRIGCIPGKIRPVLEQEGVILADEGMGGWFIARNVKGPGKRYVRRTEGFSGCLVITRKRIICYTYWKRQISISVDDPRLSELYVNATDRQKLSISFESSVFRDGWEGVIVYRFKTDKAIQFQDALMSLGVQKGFASDAVSDASGSNFS